MGQNSAQPHRWTHRRHKVVYWLLRPLLGAYYRRSYHYRGERYTAEKKNQPYLILANHNGSVDPILLAQSFRQVIYFVASDHIFRWGWKSRLIEYLVAPIPIVKAQLDLKAIRQMAHIQKEGGTIGLFPSGNGSFTGPEMPISISVAKLAKVLKMPILLFRFEGGYLTRPRWAFTTRKGQLTGRVVRELSLAEIDALTPEALSQLIREELQGDPYREDRSIELKAQRFTGKRLAEALERVLFVCPDCHQLNTLHSHDDLLSCPCGFAVRYGEDGCFHPADTGHTSELAPLEHVKAFDLFQKEYLKNWLQQPDTRAIYQELPFFSDEQETLSIIHRASHADAVQSGQLALYTDRLMFFSNGAAPQAFPIDQISFVTVHGPQTLQFQDARTQLVYEAKSRHPRSAYRYWVMIDLLKQVR